LKSKGAGKIWSSNGFATDDTTVSGEGERGWGGEGKTTRLNGRTDTDKVPVLSTGTNYPKYSSEGVGKQGGPKTPGQGKKGKRGKNTPKVFFQKPREGGGKKEGGTRERTRLAVTQMRTNEPMGCWPFEEGRPWDTKPLVGGRGGLLQRQVGVRWL